MRKIVLALLFALLPSLADAQQFPTVPDHSVIGRIGAGSGSGPSQAIPFLNLNSLLGNHVLPGTYASDPRFGMKCNGVDDDSAALQLAVNTADANNAWPVYVPAGNCPVANDVFLNKWAVPGILTVPGLKIKGQGKGVTILDTRVANGYAIAVNPAWQAAHKALAGIAPTTGGSGALTSNTYYVQLTVSDPLGNQIDIASVKSVTVTGPTGRIAITLPTTSPGYAYNAYCDTVSPPAHFCVVGGVNAAGLGGGQSINFDALGSAQAVPTSKLAVWQNAEISDLSITNSTGTANASGILYFKAGYASITNVTMQGLSGDGLDIPNYTGDIDGSFLVSVTGSKFDTIAGWCLNATGAALELSNLKIDTTVFNLCGTVPTNLNTPVTVSSIPNSSSSVVVTSGSHGLLAGDQIAFNVTGMTLASTWYRVGTAVTGNSFNLVDVNGNAVNTTSLGTFTGGTVSLSWRPPVWNPATLSTTGSGGIAWLGLIATIRNSGCTQCNNVFIYASENGTSDNLTLEAVDMENTAGKGLYIGSLAGGSWNQGECLSAVGLGSTVSCVQLGTGFAGGAVENFTLKKIKVRNNVSPTVGFEQYQNTNIGATFQDRVRVGDVTWQSFDAAGQARFAGFVFDPIPGQVQFSISAQNTVKLIPVGQGGALPLHLGSPGEWFAYHVPSAGVTGAVTGGLSANTSYNCYAFPATGSGTGTPESLGFECNSTGKTLDEGYAVKSSDHTRTFIGTATTDGSGNFQTSGAQTSQYPPGGGVATAPGAAGQLTEYTGPAALGPVTTGSGVVTALGIAIGTAGSVVTNGGALGTPSSGVGTSLTALNASNLGSGTVPSSRIGFAAKTDMQTPASSTLVVNPADVQNHPGTAKFWARLDGKTGATCTIAASYNVASCVRNSTGNYTLTYTTPFASANYAVMLGAATDTGVTVAIMQVAAAGYATGTLTFTCVGASSLTVNDCDTMSMSGLGSQ